MSNGAARINHLSKERSVLPLLVAVSQVSINPADSCHGLASAFLWGLKRLFWAGPWENQESVWEAGFTHTKCWAALLGCGLGFGRSVEIWSAGVGYFLFSAFKVFRVFQLSELGQIRKSVLG